MAKVSNFFVESIQTIDNTHLVKHLFEASWKDDAKTVPTVQMIWKIVMTKSLLESFFAYRWAEQAPTAPNTELILPRKSIEAKRNFVAQRLPPANECSKWYGLRRDCNIGDTEQHWKLCNSAQCAVCYIIRHSFRKEILWTQRPGQYVGRRA